MKEFIEKLIGRLEEKRKTAFKTYTDFGMNTDLGRMFGFKKAIDVVNQLAEEYNNESVKGDLISRSAVIELIESKCVDGCLEQDDITLIDAYGLMDDVSDLPTVYNDGWIPCSERLPKSGTSVIVSYKDRFLTQADGTCEGWYDETNMIWHLTDYEYSEYSDNVEVIAWRERLKPYQPKGEQ